MTHQFSSSLPPGFPERGNLADLVGQIGRRVADLERSAQGYWLDGETVDSTTGIPLDGTETTVAEWLPSVPVHVVRLTVVALAASRLIYLEGGPGDAAGVTASMYIRVGDGSTWEDGPVADTAWFEAFGILTPGGNTRIECSVSPHFSVDLDEVPNPLRLELRGSFSGAVGTNGNVIMSNSLSATLIGLPVPKL